MRFWNRLQESLWSYRDRPLRGSVRFWLWWMGFSYTTIGLVGFVSGHLDLPAYQWAVMHFPVFFWRSYALILGLMAFVALQTWSLVLVRLALGASVAMQLIFGCSILIYATSGGLLINLAGVTQWWGGAATGIFLLSHPLVKPKELHLDLGSVQDEY